MAELLEVVADAVTGVGGTASMHVGAFPADDEASIYVVVPHEYFVLTPPELRPGPDRLARTIGFCVEHPGTATFETTAGWAAELGATVDINRDSTVELRRRGIAARRFVMGYSRLWDQWHGRSDIDRRIDITYLGTTDIGRDHLLCEQARRLGEWRTALLIPPHEQMTRPRPDFLMGAAKHEHLVNSRILLNLHRGGSCALEWVRVLEAVVNGCVVVSEHSTDFAPLVPGTHIAFSRGSAVVDVAAALLRHPDRLSSIRDAAYTLCRDELSMRESAAELLEIGSSLLRSARARPTPSAAPSPPTPAQTGPPQPPTHLPELAPWAELIPPDGRRALASSLQTATSVDGLVVDERRTARLAGEACVVDVVVAASGDVLDLGLTLASLDDQDVSIQALIGRGADAPEVSAARGRIRNALLSRASTDLVLVIDPGQELFPRALRTLVDALTADHAAAVYPMVADTSGGVLWNSLPPEEERLARRVYIGAPFLIRRDVLDRVGGFSENPAVDGYEDHELWLRLIAAGYKGILVPQILASGRRFDAPPYGVARLMPELTIDALERARRSGSAQP